MRSRLVFETKRKAKRFLLFTFPEYYPAGGISDLAGDFDSLDEAIKAAQETEDLDAEYKRIFDLGTGEVILIP